MPWAEAFPEITGGIASTFAVHPGEDSVAVRVEGERAIWRGLAIYGTAEVTCVWNGGIDQRRFEVSCVPSSQASAESRVRVADRWITQQWARATMKGGRLDFATIFADTSVAFTTEWYNQHGERLPADTMTWAITPRAKRAHSALPTGFIANGNLIVEVPEADYYDVTLSLGGETLRVGLVVLPQPIGMGFEVKAEDCRARISGPDNAKSVRLCPDARIAIHTFYRYSESDRRLCAAIREEVPDFAPDTRIAPELSVSEEVDRPGVAVEDSAGQWRFVASRETVGKACNAITIQDDLYRKFGMRTHETLPVQRIAVKVVMDWTPRLALASVVATVVCLLCFRFADYGLDNARTTVYLVAGGAQGILFLSHFLINRARVVQLLGALVILWLFLYEFWQEML